MKKINWEFIYTELRKGLMNNRVAFFPKWGMARRRRYLMCNRTVVMGSSLKSGVESWLLEKMANDATVCAFVPDLHVRDDLIAALNALALREQMSVEDLDYKSRVLTSTDLESMGMDKVTKLLHEHDVFVICNASENFKRALFYNHLAVYREDPSKVVIVELEGCYIK